MVVVSRKERNDLLWLVNIPRERLQGKPKKCPTAIPRIGVNYTGGRERKEEGMRVGAASEEVKGWQGV